MSRLLTLSAAAMVAIIAMPAAAQDRPAQGPAQPPEYRVNQLIIYGEDPCPQSDDNTINVCARLAESERYRTPPRLRNVNSPANESWTNRAESLEVLGAFGPLSCTPTGLGGDNGCTLEMIEAAYAERAQGSDVRMGQLVAEARAERLSEIDGNAALTQARVEELERAEFERRRAAQGETLPDEEGPPPVLVDSSRIPAEPPAVPPTRDD